MKRIILLAMKNFRITKQSNYMTFIFTSSNFTVISLFNLFTSFKTSIHNTKLRNQNLHSSEWFVRYLNVSKNSKQREKMNRNDEKVEFKKFLHYTALHWRLIRLLFGLCGSKQKKKKTTMNISFLFWVLTSLASQIISKDISFIFATVAVIIFFIVRV